MCDQRTMSSNPRPDRNVDDGNAVPYNVSGPVFGELSIKRVVEAVGFRDVAGDGVGELFGGEA